MKKLRVLVLLAFVCAPAAATLVSCERKVEVKQEITDDGKGNIKESTVRKFK